VEDRRLDQARLDERGHGVVDELRPAGVVLRVGAASLEPLAARTRSTTPAGRSSSTTP